ncbi:hypothetical protein B0T10DRAFT_470103 [Thelonectria olida]|uniref:Uncharacterized protein n=1 Tax=Thelonectria olida TaxID=1576542 RepID=A0A9P9AWB5_9HYPO|nr:hypothetical protein B0T10DRAFT_470103 [Thelonectria olida]
MQTLNPSSLAPAMPPAAPHPAQDRVHEVFELRPEQVPPIAELRLTLDYQISSDQERANLWRAIEAYPADFPSFNGLAGTQPVRWRKRSHQIALLDMANSFLEKEFCLVSLVPSDASNNQRMTTMELMTRTLIQIFWRLNSENCQTQPKEGKPEQPQNQSLAATSSTMGGFRDCTLPRGDAQEPIDLEDPDWHQGFTASTFSPQAPRSELPTSHPHPRSVTFKPSDQPSTEYDIQATYEGPSGHGQDEPRAPEALMTAPSPSAQVSSSSSRGRATRGNRGKRQASQSGRKSGNSSAKRPRVGVSGGAEANTAPAAASNPDSLVDRPRRMGSLRQRKQTEREGYSNWDEFDFDDSGVEQSLDGNERSRGGSVRHYPSPPANGPLQATESAPPDTTIPTSLVATAQESTSNGTGVDGGPESQTQPVSVGQAVEHEPAVQDVELVIDTIENATEDAPMSKPALTPIVILEYAPQKRQRWDMKRAFARMTLQDVLDELNVQGNFSGLSFELVIQKNSYKWNVSLENEQSFVEAMTWFQQELENAGPARLQTSNEAAIPFMLHIVPKWEDNKQTEVMGGLVDGVFRD